MNAAPHAEPPPRSNPRRRLSSFFHRHEHTRLGGLLAAPVGWLVVVYLGSLFLLLLAAFWTTDPFTNNVIHHWNLDNFRQLYHRDVYRDVAWRTIKMAALVTIADAVLAFPIAYYMARIASPRKRNLLVVAVLTPLWASYLVKAYSWRTMLGEEGIVNWVLNPLGLSAPGDWWSLWMTFTYFWLPYMNLPIYAGLVRIPTSLLEASAARSSPSRSRSATTSSPA